MDHSDYIKQVRHCVELAREIQSQTEKLKKAKAIALMLLPPGYSSIDDAMHYFLSNPDRLNDESLTITAYTAPFKG